MAAATLLLMPNEPELIFKLLSIFPEFNALAGIDADVIFVPDTPAILASVTAALIMLALSTELSANSLEVIAFTAI